MPTSPARYCGFPRCGVKVTGATYCPAHQEQIRQAQRRHYTGIRGVNYGRRWRKARLLFLQTHPLCIASEKDA